MTGTMTQAAVAKCHNYAAWLHEVLLLLPLVMSQMVLYIMLLSAAGGSVNPEVEHVLADSLPGPLVQLIIDLRVSRWKQACFLIQHWPAVLRRSFSVALAGPCGVPSLEAPIAPVGAVAACSAYDRQMYGRWNGSWEMHVSLTVLPLAFTLYLLLAWAQAQTCQSWKILQWLFQHYRHIGFAMFLPLWHFTARFPYVSVLCFPAMARRKASHLLAFSLSPYAPFQHAASLYLLKVRCEGVSRLCAMLPAKFTERICCLVDCNHLYITRRLLP